MTGRVCRACRVGDHPACSQRCLCNATRACRKNAQEVRDRHAFYAGVGAVALALVGFLVLIASRPPMVGSTLSEPAAAETVHGLHAPEPPRSLPRVTAKPAGSGSPMMTAPRVVAATSAPEADVWTRLADCESGAWDRDGDPIPGSANWTDQRGGYEGGLHFAPSTWVRAGGARYAPHAYDATPAEQIAVAKAWLARTSPEQWPVCSKKVGLR